MPILRVMLEFEREQFLLLSFTGLRLLFCCWLSNGAVVMVTVNNKERCWTAKGGNLVLAWCVTTWSPVDFAGSCYTCVLGGFGKKESWIRFCTNMFIFEHHCRAKQQFIKTTKHQSMNFVDENNNFKLSPCNTELFQIPTLTNFGLLVE